MFEWIKNFLKNLFLKPVQDAPKPEPVPEALPAISPDKGFFDVVRKYFGNLNQTQVDGFNVILKEGEARGVKDEPLAYVLSTVWHETAHTMQPIEEYGKGRGYAYGKIDPETGKAYYGRGYPQLTWAGNYKKLGARIGVDLYRYPERMLEKEISAKVLFEGMIHGLFTGVGLDLYFNDKVNDPVNARRIINGIDKQHEIADLYYKFSEALKAQVS